MIAIGALPVLLLLSLLAIAGVAALLGVVLMRRLLAWLLLGGAAVGGVALVHLGWTRPAADTEARWLLLGIGVLLLAIATCAAHACLVRDGSAR